jgi:hypothetical protein
LHYLSLSSKYWPCRVVLLLVYAIKAIPARV